MAGLFRLWHDKHNPPPDPTDISFHGKTVLITGATSGLGFEASLKFLQQGVSSLIITSRDHDRGQQTKARLERLTGRSSGEGGVVQVWPLDMSSFDSVVEFASRVNRDVSRLDVAILNAGVMHRDYVLSQDGWEDTLQVNTLSTALLALLLKPKLRETAGYLQQQASPPLLLSGEGVSTPHLVIVSSGTAVRITAKDLPPSTSRAPLLSYLNQQHAGPAPRKRYAITKLLVEYAARSIAQQLTRNTSTSTGDVGNPDVIVNTVKPGFCVSSLGREYTNNRWYARWAVGIFNMLFARSTEAGSRVLVSASVQGYEAHGRMWKGDGCFDESGTLLRGDIGKRLQDKAWDEIVHVLREQVPQLGDTLNL